MTNITLRGKVTSAGFQEEFQNHGQILRLGYAELGVGLAFANLDAHIAREQHLKAVFVRNIVAGEQRGGCLRVLPQCGQALTLIGLDDGNFQDLFARGDDGCAGLPESASLTSSTAAVPSALLASR